MQSPKATVETRESWYGVQDRRERKRIQDRSLREQDVCIVSHARSSRHLIFSQGRRLAEAHKNSGKSLGIRHGPNEVLDTGAQTECNSVNCSSDVTWPSSSGSLSDGSPFIASSVFTTSDPGVLKGPPSMSLSHSPLPSDQQFLIDPRMGVIMALHGNGTLLGIFCGLVFIRSWRQPPTVPAVLQPTPLQLTMPHYSWIDRFPFPRFRDNLILLADRVDMEDLFLDFFRIKSFYIKAGAQAWDPTAWLVDHEFKAKWGYLFH